ncbi:MAG: fructose-6-phosphate aldolase [Clostridia bacterium]|nr:fructose-6-phosphate aldolase [Clostridia bacterium]
MRLILDTANLKDIEYFNTHYPIEGVTTNPTILSKEGGDVVALLKNIRAIIGEDKELHVQVTETQYEKILMEARAIVGLLGKNTFVKIPATDAGIRATKTLAAEGMGITVTAVLSPAQAMIASLAGASYVAPYVSRLENLCDDGVGCVAAIAEVFAYAGTKTQILAASFKTVKEVLDVATVGCHAATVGSDVMKKMLAHSTTDTSIAGFRKDWERAFGRNTLLELIQVDAR